MAMDAAMKRIHNFLHQKGYKLTPQRQATVEVLLENEEAHLSAEDIFMRVQAKNASIGLATVYRTLEVLTEMDIVNKVTFQDGLARYDLQKPMLKHSHHHLVCQNCGKITEINDDLVSKLAPEIMAEHHFQLSDHQLTFYGLCEVCQKEEA